VSHIGAVDYRQAAADRPVLVGPVEWAVAGAAAPERVHPMVAVWFELFLWPVLQPACCHRNRKTRDLQGKSFYSLDNT